MEYKVDDLIYTIMDRLKIVHRDMVVRQQDAWWILQAITNNSEAELLAHDNITLTKEQYHTLQTWLTEHIEHAKPLQYILGTVPFNDVELLVEPPILIPRPETEEWCYKLIERLSNVKLQQLAIIDVCTGTGCIALALAKVLPQATIYATDSSPQAIALAQKNAEHNAIKNVTFIHGDLFGALPTDRTFDLIVGNSPYIADHEWQTLSPSVTHWEDKNALLGGEDGLQIMRKIITQAHYFLNPLSELVKNNIPQLVLEIGYNQGATVKELLTQAQFTKITIEKDLEGKDRVAWAEW
jgi:release factor glutamine methyltransferase